jgi:hypothetical protein
VQYSVGWLVVVINSNVFAKYGRYVVSQTKIDEFHLVEELLLCCELLAPVIPVGY